MELAEATGGDPIRLAEAIQVGVTRRWCLFFISAVLTLAHLDLSQELKAKKAARTQRRAAKAERKRARNAEASPRPATGTEEEQVDGETVEDGRGSVNPKAKENLESGKRKRLRRKRQPVDASSEMSSILSSAEDVVADHGGSGDD